MKKVYGRLAASPFAKTPSARAAGEFFGIVTGPRVQSPLVRDRHGRNGVKRVPESTTFWIVQLKEGNREAAQELWERYYRRLVQLARNAFPGGARWRYQTKMT